MKIIRIDQENCKRVIEDGINDYKEAVEKMIAYARKEMQKIPNNPILDQSGTSEVTIKIGCYGISTYKIGFYQKGESHDGI